MSLVTIDPSGFNADQAREWCAQLEKGDILYFPRTPIELDPEDIPFLLGQRQTGSGLHKNIAYKPAADKLSGVEAAGDGASQRLHSILRRYSQAVEQFLGGFLLPYRGEWQLDYASFRPQEEQGRDLPLRRRNDLLHTDAFPTRPTRGARILRFFNNLHPSRARDWVVSDPFPTIAPRYTPSQIPLPKPAGLLHTALGKLARVGGAGKAIPSLQRSPYDDFMMRFHNFLKENASFQEESPKLRIEFPPGSSWMVFTDTVPHAVLAGQYALEQTFLVSAKAMVAPEFSPLAVLESMTRSSLV